MRISDWSLPIVSKACFRERWRLASRDRRREVRMTTSIGAVLRSTGLAKIDRALLARAEKPRVKVWAGSIAVGHEQRAKAYTPIRNARQMREMIEAAKLYERQTLAQRRANTPPIRNGATGQARHPIHPFLRHTPADNTCPFFPTHPPTH